MVGHIIDYIIRTLDEVLHDMYVPFGFFLMSGTPGTCGWETPPHLIFIRLWDGKWAQYLRLEGCSPIAGGTRCCSWRFVIQKRISTHLAPNFLSILPYFVLGLYFEWVAHSLWIVLEQSSDTWTSLPLSLLWDVHLWKGRLFPKFWSSWHHLHGLSHHQHFVSGFFTAMSLVWLNAFAETASPSYNKPVIPNPLSSSRSRSPNRSYFLRVVESDKVVVYSTDDKSPSIC